MFITKPMEIEERSMEIIAPHLTGLDLTDDEKKIYSRIIHASGDIEYAPIIRIHPEAIAAAKTALLRGANIFTDVEMVRRGISIRTFTKQSVRCRRARIRKARRHNAFNGGD